MDFVELHKKLIIKYPDLEPYILCKGEFIRFAVVDKIANMELLYIYQSATGKVCIEGCLGAKASDFPSNVDFFDSKLIRMPDDMDTVLKAIPPYIKTLRACVEWYNNIDFKYIKSELEALGFKQEYTKQYMLALNPIEILITLPSVTHPHYTGVIRNHGDAYQDWKHIYGLTINELLEKIMEGDTTND